MTNAPIGIFDSGIGGLTVFRSIAEQLPGYDYIYLGDNSRAPYGNRSFNTIHQYTWECVQWLFKMDCQLVILACNTASAKALRTIQQNDMQGLDSSKRVLGVIRPTAEVIGDLSQTKEIGVLGTTGTVQSGSYPIEIKKFFPDLKVYQQACPLWVPLIESGEYEKAGSDYLIKQYLDEIMAQSANIDTLLLACTHYPLLLDHLNRIAPWPVAWIDPAPAIARRVVGLIGDHQPGVPHGDAVLLYTSGKRHAWPETLAPFFGGQVAA